MMKMSIGTTATTADSELELRPGGMVVQRRTDHSTSVKSFIRVRVKYGSVHYEISINSQSTFGELKKIMSAETGVHHQDMQILYKNKERDSKMFLDLSGVKDRSKLILKEDPISQEKRLLEMRKLVAKEKATKAISDISFEVDKLAEQLSAFDKGEEIENKNVENLMEMLMNQLLKLDTISGDGEINLKKKIQEGRLHKYVEELDMLKIKNSVQPKPETKLQHSERDLVTFQVEASMKPTVASNPPVIITTRWETFDSNPISVAETEIVKPVHPKFKWELFE